MLRLSPDKKTILEQLRTLRILSDAPCNGTGRCGKCRIRILEGKVSQPTAAEKSLLREEELAGHIRLACCTTVESDVTIELLYERTPESREILKDGFIRPFQLRPLLHRKASSPVQVQSAGSPSQPSPSLSAPADMPQFQSVYYGDRLLNITNAEPIFGVAMDLGTTTVVCSLFQIDPIYEVQTASCINPQIAFGADVLSRIAYDTSSRTKTGLPSLREILMEQLRHLLGGMAKENGLSLQQIYEVAVSGNLTMVHSIFGLPLKSLGRSPYLPVTLCPDPLPAGELGLPIHPNGIISALPAASTFVGGDIVGGLAATIPLQEKAPFLFLDLGTNGEMVLFDGERMFATACSAGPALEGMNISCGMRGRQGAIDAVHIQDSLPSCRVIGGGQPLGLCGSGLLDAVGVGLQLGAIRSNGRLEQLHPLVKEQDGKRKFILSQLPEIALTQNDIRQVQLWKGAVLSGILTLLQQAGLAFGSVQTIYLSGQFGWRLSPESLIKIGVFPAAWACRIRQTGNSSLMGAKMWLLSQDERRRAADIAKCITPLLLNTMPGYDRLFTQCMSFKNFPQEE